MACSRAPLPTTKTFHPATGCRLFRRKRDARGRANNFEVDCPGALGRLEIILELAEAEAPLVKAPEAAHEAILDRRRSGARTAWSGRVAHDFAENLVAVGQRQRRVARAVAAAIVA